VKLLQFDLRDTGLGGWGSCMSALLFWKVYEGVFIPLQASCKGSYLELIADQKSLKRSLSGNDNMSYRTEF
jgi:hypothetical protein